MNVAVKGVSRRFHGWWQTQLQSESEVYGDPNTDRVIFLSPLYCAMNICLIIRYVKAKKQKPVYCQLKRNFKDALYR